MVDPPRRSSICVLLASLMVLPPVATISVAASAAQRLASPGGRGGFEAALERAEQERADGTFPESARSFAQAYWALMPKQQVGLMGEVTVDNAVSDFRQAYEQTPEGLSAFALLAEPIALLEAHITARQVAHDSGQGEPAPARLVADLARLQAQLDGLWPGKPPADSARLFMAAYQGLPEGLQLGPVGQRTVENAVRRYREAQGTNPDDIGLLEEEGVLLERFIEAHADAQAQGKVAEPVPLALFEEQERVEARLEQMQHAGAKAEDNHTPQREGGLWLGLERPSPTWKKVGFGASLGLTVAAGAATIGMGVWLTSPASRPFGFRSELLQAAVGSLHDESTTNDVDAASLPVSVSLCDYAQERPVDENGVPLGEPGTVRNVEVTTVCNKATSIKSAQIATGIVTGVAATSTLVFLGLLLVHRNRKTKPSAWRRHQLHAGAAPLRRGFGLQLGGRY